MKSAMDRLIGREIRNGSIVLESFIGGGGMGWVYLGRDMILDRPVAVKILHPEYMDEPEARAYIKREAVNASRLWHPNIIQIIELLDEPGLSLCIIMEYAPGKTLADVIEEDYPLPTSRIVRILDQVLNALQVAHRNGVIHRDLKPENIMLHDVPGQPDFVKILDFGVAKLLSPSTVQHQEQILGTPHFMSPEQAQGLFTDPRSDLYSVGVILYQTMTRELPFKDTLRSVTQKVVHDLPPLPHELPLGQFVDPALEAICLKAIEKAPDDRYQSAEQFQFALYALAHEPDTSTPEFLDSKLPLAIAEQAASPIHALIVRTALVNEQSPNTAACSLIVEKAIDAFDGYIFIPDEEIAGAIFCIEQDLHEVFQKAIACIKQFSADIHQRFPKCELKIAMGHGPIHLPDNDFSQAEGDILITLDVLPAQINKSSICFTDSLRHACHLSNHSLQRGEDYYYVNEIDELCTQSDSDASRQLPILPLLGRNKEIKRINAYISRMIEGEPMLVAIVGDTGMGKSRILHFAQELAFNVQFQTLYLHVEEATSVMPAYTLRNLYRLAQKLYSTQHKDVQNKILDTLSDKIFTALDQQCKPPHRMQKQWLQGLSFAFYRLLHTVDKPLVLFIDNYDYLDPISRAVLDNISYNLPHGMSIFISLSSAAFDASALSHYRALHLNKLDDEAIADYWLLRSPGMAPTRLAKLLRLIDGSPQSLVDIDRRFSPSQDALPSSMTHCYQMILNTVPELARRVFTLACVIGVSMPLEVLYHTCPKSWHIEQALQTLSEKYLVYTHEDSQCVWLSLASRALRDIGYYHLSDKAHYNTRERLVFYYQNLTPTLHHSYMQAVYLFQNEAIDQAIDIFHLSLKRALKILGPEGSLTFIDVILRYRQYFKNRQDILYFAATIPLFLQQDELAEEIIAISDEDIIGITSLTRNAPQILKNKDSQKLLARGIQQIEKTSLPPFFKALFRMKIAHVHYKLKQYEKAKVILNQIAKEKDLKFDPDIPYELQTNARSLLAKCHLACAENDQAMTQLNFILDMPRVLYHQLVKTYIIIAKVTLEMALPQASMKAMNMASNIALSHGDLIIFAHTLIELAKLQPPERREQALRALKTAKLISNAMGLNLELNNILG